MIPEKIVLLFSLGLLGVDDNILGCANSQDLVDFLVKRTLSRHSKTRIEHILTMLLVNSEPIVFMAFPADEGWPFPKYHGACGRFAVLEDKGVKTLSDFLIPDIPFQKRARLALQLLQIALKFTTKDKEINLYLTDWSPDNFAVDDRGLVSLIDAEHVIMVNKTQVASVKAPGWDVQHQSGPPFECNNVKDQAKCPFSFYTQDLCTHQVSDLNVYGVCHVILSRLLDQIPEQYSQNHPLLSRLVTECAWPTSPGGRLEAAHSLIEVLRLI